LHRGSALLGGKPALYFMNSKGKLRKGKRYKGRMSRQEKAPNGQGPRTQFNVKKQDVLYYIILCCVFFLEE